MDAQRDAVTPFGSGHQTPGKFGYVTYHPNPTPRTLEISEANILLLANAGAARGRQAGSGRLLPDPNLLVNA